MWFLKYDYILLEKRSVVENIHQCYLCIYWDGTDPHLSIMFELASGPRSPMHLSFKLKSAWFTILQS